MGVAQHIWAWLNSRGCHALVYLDQVSLVLLCILNNKTYILQVCIKQIKNKANMGSVSCSAFLGGNFNLSKESYEHHVLSFSLKLPSLYLIQELILFQKSFPLLKRKSSQTFFYELKFVRQSYIVK